MGIKVAASSVWEIFKGEGIDPAPERTATSWAAFLRSQADALLACDFIETVTLTGQRQYILAVIEHATRRVRVLGTTAHPTAAWAAQAARNLVMNLEETGATVKYLIRDRDAKFPPLFDQFVDPTPDNAKNFVAKAKVNQSGNDTRVAFDYTYAAPDAYPATLVTYEFVCGI